MLTNIITRLFGISADIWGVLDNVLAASKIAPVEITHLFVGVGSLYYLLKLKDNSKSSNLDTTNDHTTLKAAK